MLSPAKFASCSQALNYHSTLFYANVIIIRTRAPNCANPAAHYPKKRSRHMKFFAQLVMCYSGSNCHNNQQIFTFKCADVSYVTSRMSVYQILVPGPMSSFGVFVDLQHMFACGQFVVVLLLLYLYHGLELLLLCSFLYGVCCQCPCIRVIHIASLPPDDFSFLAAMLPWWPRHSGGIHRRLQTQRRRIKVNAGQRVDATNKHMAAKQQPEAV